MFLHVGGPLGAFRRPFRLGHGEPLAVIEGVATAPAVEVMAVEKRGETSRRGWLLRQSCADKERWCQYHREIDRREDCRGAGVESFHKDALRSLRCGGELNYQFKRVESRTECHYSQPAAFTRDRARQPVFSCQLHISVKNASGI
jgi:hypothetical protein